MRYQLEQTHSSNTGSLASMIDIIFLLIIFFVVTASFDREQLDSDVILPKVNTGVETRSLPSNRLVLNVLEDGTLKFGFHRIPPDKVATELGKALSELKLSPDTILIVNGAEKCRHKYIAQALESAANAGFDQVRINAEIATIEEWETSR